MSQKVTVLSLNIGSARAVEWNGEPVSTGIYKTAVQGKIRTSNNQLEGDHQADLKDHGGPDKAVYAFPSEHYPDWNTAYPDADWAWGAFGENLTLTGLLEDQICVGDRFRCGTVDLVVTEPRVPCFKFAIRVGAKSVVQHMIQTGHTGFYLGISEDGAMQAGDSFELVGGPSSEGQDGLTITAFNELLFHENPTLKNLKLAANTQELGAIWRERFRRMIRASENV